MTGQAQARGIPNSVWIVTLIMIAWIFYAGIISGGIHIQIDRLPWSILVPGMAVFCFGHSVVMLGHQRAILLLVLCTTLAFASEYIGESTGTIFGPYYYTDVLGPKIAGRIPVLIPLAWYMMFYPSYVVTNLLADGHPVSQGRGSTWIIWISALSALVMTAWDLTMDPIMSHNPCATGTISCLPPVLNEGTVGHPAWVWTDGGAYFGVPYNNYRGWLLTAFVVFLLYRLLERKLVHAPWPGGVSKVMAVLPVLAYGSMAFIDAWLGSSKVANVHLIAPFAMGIPFLFAAFTLFARNPKMPFWPQKEP